VRFKEWLKWFFSNDNFGMTAVFDFILLFAALLVCLCGESIGYAIGLVALAVALTFYVFYKHTVSISKHAALMVESVSSSRVDVEDGRSVVKAKVVLVGCDAGTVFDVSIWGSNACDNDSVIATVQSVRTVSCRVGSFWDYGYAECIPGSCQTPFGKVVLRELKAP